MTTDSREVITDVFTVAPGTYIGCLAARWMRVYGILVVMPFLAAVIIGAVLDFRIILATLMLASAVVPLMVLILYHHYAVSADTARAVLPKRVIIRQDREMIVEYMTGDSEVEKREVIPWKHISRIRRHATTMVVDLPGASLPMLLIPFSSIPPIITKKDA